MRRGAVYVLGQLGPAAKEAAPVLTKLHEDDPSPDVRQAAAGGEKIRGK